MREGPGKAATPGHAGISTPSFMHTVLANKCSYPVPSAAYHSILGKVRAVLEMTQLQKVSALLLLPPPELFLTLGLCSSYHTRVNHHFFRKQQWEMPWLPVNWKHLSFGVYMADEFSALQQCSVLPGVFKGPWDASTANEGTLARSCITACPAQHSCSSYHFLPLTTWLWLWTASTFCISQTNALNVFISGVITVCSAFAQGQGDFWLCDYVLVCDCSVSSYIFLPCLLYLKD